MLLVMRFFLLFILSAAMFDVACAERRCGSKKIMEDRVGPIVLGGKIAAKGEVRRVEKIDMPGEMPQSALKIELICGAQVLAILGRDATISRIVVRDPKLADIYGVHLGMSLRQVKARLGSATIYSGEEEGGYLSLGKGRLRYIFDIKGIEASVLSSKNGLEELAGDKILEEVWVLN